jgi:hypothetical protein
VLWESVKDYSDISQAVCIDLTGIYCFSETDSWFSDSTKRINGGVERLDEAIRNMNSHVSRFKIDDHIYSMPSSYL